MPETTVVQKVVCYIVRDDRLLVFRHLDEAWDVTGLQVPAGSIRAAETPESAAMREAAEETGLSSLRLVRKLGETQYDVRPYRHEVQHRHVFELQAPDGVAERWTTHERDPEDGSGTKALECYWIPLQRGHVLAAGQGALLGQLGSAD